MVWVNKVRKNPLPYKFFESGIWWLPHYDGKGIPDGSRKLEFSY